MRKSSARISALVGLGGAAVIALGCSGSVPPANRPLVGAIAMKPLPAANQPMLGGRRAPAVARAEQGLPPSGGPETLERSAGTPAVAEEGDRAGGAALGFTAGASGRVPLAVRSFATQAGELSTAHADPRHPETVDTLHALAAAVRALGASGRFEKAAAAIDRRADQLARSTSASLLHADATKQALLEAVRVLDTLEDERPADPELAAWLDEARGAVDAINAKGAYLRQEKQITLAFQRVAELMVEVAKTQP